MSDQAFLLPLPAPPGRPAPASGGGEASGRLAAEHRLLRARAARRGPAGRPRRGARCAVCRAGRRRRYARGLLLDAARRVRETARAFAAVRSGVPDVLSEARLSRQAARDALAAGAIRRAGSAGGGREPCAGGAVRRHERQEAAGGTRDRARHAPHGVRSRGPAEEGLRADERGRDRAGEGCDQAAGALARRGEDAAAWRRTGAAISSTCAARCAPA